MTGVEATSKPMSEIPPDMQQYFVERSTYVGGQEGVINIAGFNTIKAAGDPPNACCAFEPNPSQKT